MKISDLSAAFVLSLLVCGCNQPQYSSGANFSAEAGVIPKPKTIVKIDEPSSDPFIGIDMAKQTVEQNKIMQQASNDFSLASKGLAPTCMKEPNEGYSDGGTVVYACPHYELTVMKRLTTFQGVDGYLYGPIIKFENDYSVSNVKFYTYQALNELLGDE